MTVYRRGFPTPKPLPRIPPAAAEPVVRSDPPRPAGKPVWLGDAPSVEEYEYRRAVERAFAKRWEPEVDPLYDFIWGE
jgi:hypothetical protein